METKEDIWKRLARPFPPEAVDIKVQATSKDRTRGRVVAYVDARAVMRRLDGVVGVEGWSDSYELEGPGTAICRLTIGGVTKEDVGMGDDPKAAYSDALKRAAVKFGVGR